MTTLLFDGYRPGEPALENSHHGDGGKIHEALRFQYKRHGVDNKDADEDGDDASGEICFVAYQASLTPEFEIDGLPDPLKALLSRVATATTRNLHAGIYQERPLKDFLRDEIEAMATWLDSDDGWTWQNEQKGWMAVCGLHAFARQFEREMVIRREQPADVSIGVVDE